MKLQDQWHWPDKETHMPAWMANPKNRMIINGRPAYQGKKQQALIGMCKRFRTAVDIGAHIGTWTYNLAPLFETVRAFEPMAEHRDCLAMNIEAPNVIIYPLALGPERGSVRMQTSGISTGDTWVDPSGPGDIDMHPLDAFEWKDIDLIKVDAEGYEEHILRGARQTIIASRPVICVEQKRDWPKRYGLQPQGAVTFLQSLGYVLAREMGGDYLMTMPDGPEAA
jgi:FkbM family methyltransferase